MSRLRAGVLGALLLISSAGFAKAQVLADSAPQTLEDAITQALRNEPSIVAAEAGQVRANAGLQNAIATKRGILSLQGQGAYGSNDYGRGYNTAKPYSLSLGYERILWDGGAIAAGIAGATSSNVSSQARLTLTRSQIRAQVAQAWIELASSQEQVNLSQAHVAAVARFERDASLQFEAGEVSRSVVAQATARRAQAGADLEAATNANLLARSELTRLIGTNVSVATLPELYPTIPSDLAAALPALRDHPALKAAEAQIDASRSSVRQARGRGGPQIVGGVRGVHVRDEFLPDYRNDGVEGYVRFVQPLWDGGARKAAVFGARASVGEAEATKALTQRALEHGLRQAYANRETALSQVQAASAMVAASRVALDSMEAEFRLGERPLVNVLDARRDLAQADGALVRARGNFILSHWWIDAALGRGG